MSVLSTDLAYYQSSLPVSIGGTISSIVVPSDVVCSIFPQTTLVQQEDGGTVYAKIFLKNSNLSDALGSFKVWALLQPISQEKIALGLGTDTDTDPNSVSFSSNPITVSSLTPGQAISIWIRKTIPAELADFDNATFQLALKGIADPTVVKILTFSWILEPQPSAGDSMSELDYSLSLQLVDGASNDITSQVSISNVVPVPSSISSDNTVSVPAGQIDFPVQMIAAAVDFIVLATDVPITVKFNSITDTAFSLPALGVMVLDVKSVTAIFVTNTNSGPSKIRCVQAVR